MASYKILPLMEEGIDIERVRERVESESALKSDQELRSGTLPRTFQSFRGVMCYVEYAEEDYAEVTTLEGRGDRIKVADMYPIIFLGNGFVAYDANLPNKDVEDSIINLVTDLLKTDIRYEAVTFDKDTLHDIVERSDKVQEADFAPSSQKPENVSARYLPGLQETTFWDQYGSEPMEKVRVDLPDQESYNISFYEKGKVTIHGREIPPEIQVDLLRYITEEIVSNLDIETFQRTLGGDYK